MIAIKPKILILISYYLPAYKAGGPLRSISNMVEQISDDFEFWIITLDRDLGDSCSYQNTKLNEWVEVNGARVFYATSDRLTIWNLTKLIKATPCDVLYLNSFFDYTFTIKPLLIRKFFLHNSLPVILAPRGELSEGALNIKNFRKKLMFISVSKLFGLYKKITWQASSEFEKNDIKSTLTINPDLVFISKDLPGRVSLSSKFSSDYMPTDGVLRVVFLSRISPKKNLDYALRVLHRVNISVQFDIYGPLEDEVYWHLCSDLIESLPVNIKAKYCGVVLPDNIADTFSQYDLFFFPTQGENYGHVIAESLSVGTPVLISGQTPWRNLLNDGLGWDLSLDEPNIFVQALEHCFNLSTEERLEWREEISEKGQLKINNAEDVEANKTLFLTALN